jgi:hypothetical protein
MNYLENCVFVDESAFNINMRPSGGWAEKGKPAIVTAPSTRAVSHTILGVISSKFAVFNHGTSKPPRGRVQTHQDRFLQSQKQSAI